MLDIAAFASLIALCFLAFLFLQILRFAACKRTFDPQNPFRGTFNMSFTGKCDQGFTITAMLMFCLCSCFIVVHMIQSYQPGLLNPSSLSPSNYR